MQNPITTERHTIIVPAAILNAAKTQLLLTWASISETRTNQASTLLPASARRAYCFVTASKKLGLSGSNERRSN